MEGKGNRAGDEMRGRKKKIEEEERWAVIVRLS